MKIDESLNDGGLDEVAAYKKENPPTKSPLLKILTEVNSKKSAEAAGEEGKEADDLALDSIGCTANVVMVDYS